MELGYDEIPCIRLDHMTDDERRAYALAHNSTSLETGFDFDKLNAELESLKGSFDLVDFGLEFSKADDAFEAAEDDFEGELPDDPIVRRGDAVILGKHRLVCGDSTNADDVARLMDGKKADLAICDPPYGVKRDKGFGGADGFSGKGKPIARRTYKDNWDNISPEQSAFDNIITHSEYAIIWGGNFFTDKVPVGTFWLVWDKNQTMPTFGDCELAWTNIERKSIKKYDITYNGLIGKEKERFHPTQKPVKLYIDVICDFSEKNDIILDLFLGSGSTLIAAEQTARICYGCEINEKYCDVITNRYIQFKQSDSDVHLIRDGQQIPWSELNAT